MRNKDDDEEEVSSDECNVKLTEIMPLTIGTNTVNTQVIAISVHIHGNVNSFFKPGITSSNIQPITSL